MIDSTGLKVYGEGEWNGRQHGASRRRPWRQFPWAVDPGNHEGMAAELTAAFGGDAEVLPGLVEQLPADEPIESVAADGAYHPRACHEALLNRRAAALIPPRGGAAPWPPLVEGQLHPRTAIIAQIQQPSRRAWKIERGYQPRSLAETAMFGLKSLCGGRLKNRRFDTQATQAYARLAAINIMTRLGMPNTVAVC